MQQQDCSVRLVMLGDQYFLELSHRLIPHDINCIHLPFARVVSPCELYEIMNDCFDPVWTNRPAFDHTTDLPLSDQGPEGEQMGDLT